MLSTEPAQAVVRILDGFMLNNQHSEVREPESMILILQQQSLLLMIMRIYNDDDIFVLAKHKPVCVTIIDKEVIKVTAASSIKMHATNHMKCFNQHCI